MKHSAVNSFGWYGVLAILLAYALVSFNVIVVKSYAYQFLNLSGALGIIFEAFAKKDMQPVVLNSLWAIVALVSMVLLITGK